MRISDWSSDVCSSDLLPQRCIVGLMRGTLLLLLTAIGSVVAAQGTITVTGQVTDSEKSPLIGASVVEKGTTNGVITDADRSEESRDGTESVRTGRFRWSQDH